MLIVALFTVAKIWKQPKCPLTEEWIKNMWCIYTIEYYSAIKKNEIMPFAATWMDLKIFILSEISETEKEKYHMIFLICRIEKEMIQLNLSTKEKQTHPLREQVYGCQGRRMWRKDREFGINMYTLLYLKQITNEVVMYSTGTVQCYVTAQMGEEFRGEWIHVYVWLSPFAVSLKLLQHC